MSRELRERGLLLGVNDVMALAHHIMWTVYGRWLPNDLRGSLSKRVRSDALYETLGPVKMRGRAAVRPRAGALRAQDASARGALKHPVRLLTGAQAKAAAIEVGRALSEWGIGCFAFAVLPDHVHAVIERPERNAHEVILALQRRSRRSLRERWPDIWGPDHPVWTRGGGHSVYLQSPLEVEWAISYVERNPIEAGLPTQRWSFVRAPE